MVGVWWSCVFWTLPGAVCITHLLKPLELIPEDLGLVWAFLVLQFGILHQGHQLLWCVLAAEKNSCENVPMFMCCSFSCEITKANLCTGYDHYLSTVEQGKKKAHLFYKEAV